MPFFFFFGPCGSFLALPTHVSEKILSKSSFSLSVREEADTRRTGRWEMAKWRNGKRDQKTKEVEGSRGEGEGRGEVEHIWERDEPVCENVKLP